MFRVISTVKSALCDLQREKLKYGHYIQQGSPNQAKWATSLPWFQRNRPISVKKRSFFKSFQVHIFFHQ